jgi:exopolyphosphatase/guanosine-5'-triphosphate,3'-diphosphate pyrophosphatase
MNTGLRFAAIDIGSNAIRLLFARIFEHGNNKSFLIKESLIRMPLRLGQDVFIDGKISARNSEKFLKTMKGFKDLIDAYEPISYRACATAAMRNAKNGQDLVAAVKLKTNIKIEIIDGSKEAALILSKNINQYLKSNTNYIHIDVGGGSTELSIINNNKIKISRSFPIGSVRLLEGKVNDASWQQMRNWIIDNKKNIIVNKAIGSGGNINKIASMLGKKKGKHIEFDFIKKVIKKIKIKNYDQRITQLGLRPDRADVIDYASKIYLRCMKWAGVKKILVPQSGLADGIIEELYDIYKADKSVN